MPTRSTAFGTPSRGTVIGTGSDGRTNVAFGSRTPAPPPSGGSGPTPPPDAPPPPTPPIAPMAPLAPTPVPGVGDARALLTQALQQFGLGSEASWAYQQLTAGKSMQEILIALRTRPAHKERFAAFHQRAQTDRPISEAEILALEDSYIQVAREFGLPEGFYDQPGDFTEWIVKDVAPNELASRLAPWKQYSAQMMAMPENAPIVEEMQRLHGVAKTQSAFLAWAIDPDRALPTIERAFQSAQIGAAARTTGYGMLSLNEAQRLQALGVNEGQAQQGFSRLGDMSGLFNTLPGSDEEAITRGEQLGAEFEGNAQARRRIRRREEERRAGFGGGSGYMGTQTGTAGLASARR